MLSVTVLARNLMIDNLYDDLSLPYHEFIQSTHLTSARASSTVTDCCSSTSSITHPVSLNNMNEVLQQLRPQQALRPEDGDEFASKDAAAWGSRAGYGNLSASGGIESMNVPRVLDVSQLSLSRDVHS